MCKLDIIKYGLLHFSGLFIEALDRYKHICVSMDTASAINRELLECPVCCDNYNYSERVPRNLSCGHTFCTSCLKKILKEKSITCPLCQAVHAQKDSDVSGIPQDITRQNLMDILNKSKKTQTCTQCDESNTAINFCNDCEEYICCECTNAHKRTKITKSHKLRELGNSKHETLKSDSESAAGPISCKAEKQSDKQTSLFCLDCNENLYENSAERHPGHKIKQLKEVYIEQQHELKTIVDKIRQTYLPNMTKQLEEKTKEVKEKGNDLKSGLTRQFEIYNGIIAVRLNVLKSQVDKATESFTESLQRKDLMSNVQHQLSEADSLLEDKNPASFLKSSRCVVGTLADLQSKISKMPEVAELRYSQTCTTEDFDKIVGALGSIQGVRPQNSDGGYTHGVTRESSSEASLIASLQYESSQRDQLMEVLKSLSTFYSGENPHPEALHSRSIKLDLCEEKRSINNGTLENVPKAVEKDVPNLANRIERNIPKGGRDLMRSDAVKRLVRLRFQTREIEGYWTVDDDKVEMFGRSSEEADECMQLLKETVQEKTLKFRKGSEFIVDSDKWQIITGNLKRKYPDQVQIEVNRENNQVVIYSTCTTILKDTYDALRIFLRNNQMKIITLYYEVPVVTFIMKHTRRLQRIRNDFSQYCLDISPVDSSKILLKGIGFKVVKALRMLHALGSRYAKGTEEDRFDSDDESEEDDEERFTDEEKVYADTAVQMYLDVEGKETLLRALCFPCDDKQIYVTMGDITELPVEAVVNAADKTLKHSGGLAKALVEKGGRSIQENCTDYVQRHGSVQVGQVYCSDAGSLPCSVIIHAVGPRWIDGKNDESAKLSECITNCLNAASRLKLSSVAFPAVSAGTYKFPIRDAALTITKAVKDFLRQKPSCSIREIYFCDKCLDTVNEFAASLKEQFDDEDLIFSSGQEINKQPENGKSEAKRYDLRPLLFI